MRSTQKLLTKVLLSLFIAYHLTCVVITPMITTYLGMRMQKIVAPYVSFFEFTNAWSFFAPDPGPPPVFLEYELLDSQRQTLLKGSMPERKSPYFLRDRQNRLVAAVEFMMISDARIEQMMLPYLCKAYPQANEVKLWKKVDTIPSLYDVADGKRHIGDEVNFERRFISQSFCEGKR